MSLHYLLDGYNILKQMPAFRDLPLEEGRRGFLDWIRTAHPQGSMNNSVTVIFDGHPDYFGSLSDADIRVIFSEGCSADDTIKRMVEDDCHEKTCVVVSNDKDIRLYARALGAQIMGVEMFTRAHPEVHVSLPSEDKTISLSCQAQINKELYGLWVKKS